MSLVRKLKPDRSITGALIPLSMLPIFGFTALIFGIPTGMLVLAVMIALFGLFYLYVFLRTWNAYLLVIRADCAFLVAMLTIVYVNITQTGSNYASNPFESREYALAYFSGLFFFGVVLIFLTLTRRLKWRGREVFELAAETIEETGNGYTSRPRPVGKVDYSLQQLSDFARFCSRHLIALPYITSKNITLVIVKNSEEIPRLLGLSGDYRDVSWVNFDVEGEVSVHISQKDYIDYREPLAFDIFFSGTPTSRTRLWIAPSNSLGVGSFHQTLLLIPTTSDLWISFFHTVPTSLSPRRVPTDSSSMDCKT